MLRHYLSATCAALRWRAARIGFPADGSIAKRAPPQVVGAARSSLDPVAMATQTDPAATRLGAAPLQTAGAILAGPRRRYQCHGGQHSDVPGRQRPISMGTAARIGLCCRDSR